MWRWGVAILSEKLFFFSSPRHFFTYLSMSRLRTLRLEICVTDVSYCAPRFFSCCLRRLHTWRISMAHLD